MGWGDKLKKAAPKPVTDAKQGQTRAPAPRHAPEAPKKAPSTTPPESKGGKKSPKSTRKPPKLETKDIKKGMPTPTPEPFEDGPNMTTPDNEPDLNDMEAEVRMELQEAGVKKPSLEAVRAAMIDRVRRDASADLPADGQGNATALNMVPRDLRPKLGASAQGIRNVTLADVDGLLANSDIARFEAEKNGEAKAIERWNKENPDAPAIVASNFSLRYEETEYLRHLRSFNRAYANYALRWRPIVLASLTLSPVQRLAQNRAGVDDKTFTFHYRADPVFAAQVDAAKKQAYDLLHARAFQIGMEGVMRPVFFQGVVCGYTQEYDTKLLVELLRGHLGETFKPPVISNKVQVNTGIALNASSRPIKMDVLREIQRRTEAAQRGTTIDRTERLADAKEVA